MFGFSGNALRAGLALFLGVGTGPSTANASAFNFGNFTAPSAGRLHVLCVSRSDGSVAVNDIQIGGSAATLAAASGAGSRRTAYGWRDVAAGAQNVTVNMTGATSTNTILGVGVWWEPAPLATEFSTSAPGGSAGDTSAPLSLNMPGAGWAIAGVVKENTEATVWSGAVSVYDATVGAGRISFAGAEIFIPGSAVAITPSWTTSTGRRSIGATISADT